MLYARKNLRARDSCSRSDRMLRNDSGLRSRNSYTHGYYLIIFPIIEVKNERKHPPTLHIPFRTNGVATYGYLFLCLNAILLRYLQVTSPILYEHLVAEDALVENLAAVWLLLGGILFFAAALRERGFPRRQIYILECIALIYGCGEEISWGQRIFDYPTPDILYRINTQNETNIHNFDFLSDLHDIVFLSGIRLLWIIPTAALLCRKNSVFGIPLPSMLLTLVFLIVFLYRMPAPSMKFFFLGNRIGRDHFVHLYLYFPGNTKCFLPS